jgi:hypothetical protein
MTTVQHWTTAGPVVGTTIQDMTSEGVECIMEAQDEDMKIETEDTSRCTTQTEVVLQEEKIIVCGVDEDITIAEISWIALEKEQLDFMGELKDHRSLLNSRSSKLTKLNG